MRRHYLNVVILVVVLMSRVMGQDIEKALLDVKNYKTGKLVPRTLLSLQGNLSAQQILYSAWGIQNRQSPYNYNYSGNLNITLIDKINVPEVV